jgi:hypothetical protein
LNGRKREGGRSTADSCPAVVEEGCLYTLGELAQRLRWKRHSTRQALRNGLRTSKFGSRRYVLGADALAFFRFLAEQQAEP